MTVATTATNNPPANANSECVGPQSEQAGKVSACEGCPNQKACSSGAMNSPEALARAAAEAESLKSCLNSVSHTILVLSGKGGVGKSTVASQMAHTLASQGFAVGLLDVDLCGPSAPRMVLGDQAASQTIHKSASGLWTPVYGPNNLAVISISFMLQDRNQAVIWRGPRKNALIQQFLTEVDWTGETDGLDYLIVDTPPGTSDEHISTVQYLQKAGQTSGAVVVTTAEEASLSDVRKELSFCKKTNVPVLGVIENMGTFETTLDKLTFIAKENGNKDCTEQVLQTIKDKCPEILLNYTVKTDIFAIASNDGAEQMCKDFNCEFWGHLPLDPNLLKSCEHGQCFIEQHPNTKAAIAMIEFCKKLSTLCPVDMS